MCLIAPMDFTAGSVVAVFLTMDAERFRPAKANLPCIRRREKKDLGTCPIRRTVLISATGARDQTETHDK